MSERRIYAALDAVRGAINAWNELDRARHLFERQMKAMEDPRDRECVRREVERVYGIQSLDFSEFSFARKRPGKRLLQPPRKRRANQF